MRHRHMLINLVHGLPHQAKLHHRAMAFDKPRIRGAARGGKHRRDAGFLLHRMGHQIRQRPRRGDKAFAGNLDLKIHLHVKFRADLTGFVLRDRLADRLGDNPAGSYALAVTLTQSQTAAAIDSDGVTTRVTLVGQADWTLTDRATGATLGTGAVDNFTAYSATGTTVATEAAASDASDRLAVILADAITADLILLASGLP